MLFAIKTSAPLPLIPQVHVQIALSKSTELSNMANSTTPPSLSIPTLTDDNYPAWLAAATTAAKKVLPTQGPLGGLGLLLPTEDYKALNAGQDFLPATKPGQVTNAATTYEQLTYDREVQALATLTSSVYDSLPRATRQSCPGYDATYGDTFISLPIMFAHAHAKHSDTTTRQYHKAKAALRLPYTQGTDMDAYIASHVDSHLACARTQNVLNDIDKLELFIDGLGGRSGPFAFTINTFEEQLPQLHLRKFEDVPGHDDVPARSGLATRIREAAPRILANPTPTAPVTTSGGYYGASAAFREEIAAAIRDVLPSMLPATVTTTPQTTTTQQQSRRNRTKYCWSHGLCAHTGRECRNPHAGHDVTAHAQNRRGGSTKGCKK